VADALVVETKESSVPGPSGKGYCVVVGEAAQININDTATFGDDLIQKGDLTSTPAFKPWIPCTVGLRHAFTNTSPNSSNTDSRVTITSKGDTLQFHQAPIGANDPDETTPGNQSITLSFAQGRTERFWILAVADPTSGDKHTLEIRYGGDSSGPILIEQPVVPLEFITPAGDPVNAPVDAGTNPASIPDGANEFTFSTATSGVLTMKLKVKVPGIGSMPAAEQAKFTFELDTITNSTFNWDATDNPGGRVKASGDYITAKATYTGLPEQNDQFGLKKARLKYDGNVIAKAEFEVFFPRDETNHPGKGAGTDPNWFFYWLQTVTLLGPNPVVEYTKSGSAYNPNTNKFKLSDGDRLSYDAPYGTNNPLQGIDNFAWTARHESQHYKDWCDYWDVENQGVTKWQAAYGKDGPDDNKDPQTTSKLGSDYLPNNVEDLNLNKAFDGGDRYDWSNGLSNLAGTPAAIIDDAEDYTCKRHKTVKGDHSKDWANPGMQHKTLDKYDD
jgi:hypothetical protein